MKTYIKFHIILSVIILIPAMIWSQDPRTEFKNQMNVLFEYMDKSKITSGLLSDYAFEPVEIAPFNGVPSDSNFVDMDTWISLYCGIYDAKINDLITLETPESIAGKFGEAATVNNAIPLAAMHYQYDKLDDDALNKGWVTYTGGRIREVTNAPPPYLKKNLFAVAPQNLIFESNTVAFVFKSELFFRNNTQNVSRLEINFNNESGYKVVAWDTPLNYSFSSSGTKTIYYRITYSDGTSYISRTNIFIKQQQLALRSETNKTDSVPLKKNNFHSGGQLEIRYAPTNSEKILKKPLIIAAPFDMSSILTSFPHYSLDEILFRIGSLQGILQDLMEYDIVYVSYKEGMDDIFRNAALFKEAVQWVNDNKAPDASPNVVLGISMGGLVARYALRSMELEGVDHDTWKYISLDSPHKGANVPLGLQAMIRDIQGIYLSIMGFKVMDVAHFVPILDQLYGVLDAKASRQMLIYYCKKGMIIDNSEHEKFQQEYDRVGFPLKCQNIAVSCGSVRGATQFDPGSCLFSRSFPVYKFNTLASMGLMFGGWIGGYIGVYAGDLSAYTIGLMNVVPGNSAVKSNFVINALPDRKAAKIYDGNVYYEKKLLWFIPVKATISHNSLSSKADMLPLDGSAGAYTPIPNFDSDNEIFKKIMDGFKPPKLFTFVPATSSLALSNWKDLVNKDIRSRDLYAEGLTEFESYICAPDTNYTHCLSPDAPNFIAKHLVGPPICFDTPGSSFNISAHIALKNPMDIPISWSITNSNIGLGSPSNTSVNVYCNKSNETGVLKASSSIPLPPSLSTALGATSINNEARKRLTAKDNTFYILGGFPPTDSLAVLKVNNWAAGTPVIWELSDNTHFRIASAANDSVVIEALSYNKPLTVKASLQFVGQNISAQTTITSPKLNIGMPSKFDCRKTPVLFFPQLSSGADNVEWSLSSTDYIQFEGATNEPVTFLQGLKNTLAYNVMLTLKLTTAGEQFTVTNPVEVAIPESFGLSVLQISKKTTPHMVLVRAIPNPFNDRDAFYRWHSSSGTIKPCAENYNPYLYTGEIQNLVKTSDFEQMAEAPLENGNQIQTDQLSPSLVSALADALADATGEESINEDDLVITRLATVDSDDGADAVVIGISKSSSNPETGGQESNPSASPSITTAPADNYIVLSNPGYQTTTPIDDYDPWPLPPDNDPSYAILTYNGEDVIITCQFVSPCNGSFIASVSIAKNTFTCTYTNDNHCITIINDGNSGGQGSGNTGNTDNTGPQPYHDPNTGMWIYPDGYSDFMTPHIYSVYIYNDFGLVKTATFISTEKTVNIPMNGQQAGFYYVNIVDEQGNIVSRQTVRVY